MTHPIPLPPGARPDAPHYDAEHDPPALVAAIGRWHLACMDALTTQTTERTAPPQHCACHECSPPAPVDPLALRNGKRDAAPWPTFRAQMTQSSPTTLARRVSRHRAALAADARAQYRSSYREWSGRRWPWTPSTPRTPWPAARPGQVTDADALHLALETIGARPHCSDRVPDDMDDETPTHVAAVRLEWPERSETRPAVLTSPRALLAVPGALPQPLDNIPPTSGVRSEWVAAPGTPIYLTAGTWTDEHGPAGGRVAHRVRLDIDGKLLPSGGRGNVARRPSTVPPGAVRTADKCSTADRGRLRLWLHLDPFGQVQAHDQSGHPVALTPRARAAAHRRYFPTGTPTI